MSKSSGKKKKKNTIEIKKLKPGDKFELSSTNGLKGVVLHISDMETSVYWYSIPDHWFKKNYNEETLIDENGNHYEGLDIYFYKKKTPISSETTVTKITNNGTT
jgi:hypothetical protein